MESRNRWIVLIKSLRTEHGVGIADAERMALAQPEWCRWVEGQINANERCRQMALNHMRDNGGASLIIRDGDALKVRS